MPTKVNRSKSIREKYQKRSESIKNDQKRADESKTIKNDQERSKAIKSDQKRSKAIKSIKSDQISKIGQKRASYNETTRPNESIKIDQN